MGHYVAFHFADCADEDIYLTPTHKPATKYYRKCRYCDGWYSKELTKCPNCTAPAETMED